MTVQHNVYMKAGPLRNGAERGHGRIWHAVIGEPYSGRPAICGDRPAIQWSSWTPPGQQVTCKKCRRLLAERADDAEYERLTHPEGVQMK